MLKKVMPVAVILAVIMSLLAPATPAHAWLPRTWDTQAAFNTGLITHVDTASSPNNVLLATNLDTGDGSDGPLTISDFYPIDDDRAAVVQSSYINSSYIHVNPTSNFTPGDEVLIIQMTGTGAGTWETDNISPYGVEPTVLNFTRQLRNAYYADASSQAQVIRVPHYTDVTINAGGILTCHPWYPNGPTGGVIFFRANGTVTINNGGFIDASGSGFQGGSGGSAQGGGSGGQGGARGSDRTGDGYDGSVGGGGGAGGEGGLGIMVGWAGGDGGQRGYGGAAGQQGGAGGGPNGGNSDQGGTNGSTAGLSLMQSGSGGGGGSSGRQGYGGGGGGGGGRNACVTPIGGQNGKSGNSGGNPGAGGSGGLGGGIIAVHANKIVANQGSLIKAQGQESTVFGANGGAGGSGGTGGFGENMCVHIVNGSEQDSGAGGGGGGGNGGTGGGGGNGGGGGGGGVLWLAANSIGLATNSANAAGAPGGATGQGGGGGSGGSGGGGGSGDGICQGKSGANGASGPVGQAGTAGGRGGGGAVRLDYTSLSGSTSPAPGYTSGLYYTSGSIASDRWDTGLADQPWNYLSWQETVPSGTGITFEARASNSEFDMNAATPAWRSVGGTSPVTSGLPSGRYMQWRATFTTTNSFYSPALHSVTAGPSNRPLVATNEATNIAYNGAVLNGTLLSLGQRSGTVYVHFQWGTTPTPDSSWQTTAALAFTAPGTYAEGLLPLSPGTTYYYRSRAWDLVVYDPVYGEVVSFSTSYISPSVTTNSAGSITSSSAVLNGYLSARGSATTDNVSFQWGTTQGGPYPNSTDPQVMDNTGGFQSTLSNLGPNTSYYYRAKADGGINGAGYGAEISFTTSRAPPSVTTGDAGSVTSSSATLNGALAHMGTAATVNLSFRYGTTQGGPYPNSTSLQAKTTSGPFTASLTGLTANTTYYFMASGDGGVNGTGYGSEMSFTTSKVPPSVATAGAHNITAGSTTLNGQVVSLGTATTVNASFQWGTQQDNLNNETPYQVLTVPMGFQANLTGLAANTTYYYRARADGGVHGIGYGVIMSFRTARVPPSVTTNSATLVPPDSATLNGTLHSLGSAPMVEVSFQYGTTSGMYSDQTTPQTRFTATDFDAPLTALAAGTTYYYRAKADGGINGIAYGAEHMFTTGRTPPTVTTDNATHVTTNTAMLNGNLTYLGTAATVNVSFQYGTTQGGPYPNLTPVQPMTALVAFQAGLTGLSPHTTYYYRAKADGGINGSSYGDETSFRTSMFPPYVETLPATGTGSADTVTLNGNLYNMGSATTVNVSFQYGVTHGGPYPISTPPEARSAAGVFDAGLTGLTSGTTYYYRARGDGGAYGVSNGAEMSFTTSSVPPSVVTNGATAVTAGSATLNGDLTLLGTATTVNVSFQYGNTHGGPYPSSTTPQAKTDTDPPLFLFNLTGLPGDTTYYYRAKADGGVYGTGYGAEENFTTSMVRPSVTTDNATDVAATSATINGFLDSMGTSPTDNVSFVWGTTSNPSTPTENQTMSSQGYFHADIIGLAPLTTYYFKARADGGAHGRVEGSECSFTTGATPPSVSTGAATDVGDHTATLNGGLHSMGTATSDNVSFQWGTSPNVYSSQTSLQVFIAPGDFTAVLSGLSVNTTYYYRAVASGGRNGTSFGAEHAFTTSADPPEVTTNAATHMTTDTAWLNGNLTDPGTATTDSVSFVYGTTPKGPYPNSTPLQAKTSAGAFHAGITGLTPFTTYYFKAKADGGIYGTGYGAEDNFTTNHLPPVVWTGRAGDIMTNAATLNGNLYLMGSAPTVNVSFEYGITKGGPYTETALQSMTEPEAFHAHLISLIPDTTYYYRARGAGSNGSGTGAEQVFTTSSFPPAVTTHSATGIVTNSATLNGRLDSRGTATTVNVSYEWGTTHRGPYPNSTTPQARTTTGDFQANLSGLAPFTVYYYRARADGGIYGLSHGAEMSFITPLAPPSVITDDATSITSDSAVLHGELTSPGNAGTVDVSFQWGLSRGGPYANGTPPHTLSGPASFWSNLGTLSPGMTYYFIAMADGGVYGVSYGTEKSFTTVSPPAPPPYAPPAPRSSGQTSTVSPAIPVPLPNVVVQSASLSAASVSPGTPVTVTANVANRGTVNGSARITLYVNGEEDSSQGVTVASGGNRTVYFTVNRSQPGTYDVYVGGTQAGSFVVADYIDPDSILFISMAMILCSLVLGIIYIWRKRQQEY